MNNTHDICLVFLTYKNKILLMRQDNRESMSDTNTWCFIGGSRKKNESLEKTILREIKEKTNLHLTSVNLLTTIVFEGKEKYFFHGELTADNLNSMNRTENQSLDFFTLQQVEKLFLSGSIKMFLSDQQDVIQEILRD